jgi:hypothetical protein
MRSQYPPRKASGERQSNNKIPAIKRLIQIAKVNVGTGTNGSRVRIAHRRCDGLVLVGEWRICVVNKDKKACHKTAPTMV